jgi:hypothetical protein
MYMVVSKIFWTDTVKIIKFTVRPICKGSLLPYMNILASSVRRNRYNSLAESGLEGCIYQGPGENGD